MYTPPRKLQRLCHSGLCGSLTPFLNTAAAPYRLFTIGKAASRTESAATLPFPKRLGKPEEFGMMVDQMVRNPILNGEVIRLDCALRMAPK